MNRDETLAWMAALQAQFGQLLRTPLDRASGQLRAPTRTYDEALCAQMLPGPKLREADRLAVYHRQYWFRLFSVLQHEYLLTARLVGMWHFNGIAAKYLSLHPPTGHDLQRVAPAFCAFLRKELEGRAELHGVASTLLIEASQIDHVFSRVFLAPPTRPLRREALAQLDLSRTRLTLAASAALVREGWPLVALRREAQREQSEQSVAPARLTAPQHWLVLRNQAGHAFVPLEPQAYRLFELLGESTVSEALGQLESECSEPQRAALPARVRRWLRDGMDAGMWTEASE